MLVPHLRNEIQDSPQKCDVFVQIDAEVMRMPPQMIDFCLLCCVANTAGYPVKLQTVERCQAAIVGPEEPAGRQIHDVTVVVQRVGVVSRNVGVGVEEPVGSCYDTFALHTAPAIKPGLLGAAIALYAQLSTYF